MKIGVVIPSRLQVNPASPRGNLYLKRAIDSVRMQTVAGQHDIRIVVGVDDDGEDLKHTINADVVVGGHSQAEAVNAAAAEALRGGVEVLALVEDDDHWHTQKLDAQLAALVQGYDFVSCSQREVTPDGDYVRVNDFATMSGWLMPAATWYDVGQMDETFKWHIDTEWLGRLNADGKKRLHLAEHGAVEQRLHFIERPGGPPGNQMGWHITRDWLKNVARRSAVATTDGLLEPLVTRTVNTKGGMARIASDAVAAAESKEEHMRMLEQFKEFPW